MQTKRTYSATSIQILPSSLVYQFNLAIDTDTSRGTEAIIDSIKTILSCKCFIPNVAQATYPNDSFYYCFYESDRTAPYTDFNEVGTHIINHPYNSDIISKPNDDNSPKCFGRCYIVGITFDCQLFDSQIDYFMNAYNKIHTINGIEERNYQNRLYRPKDNNLYCLFKNYKPK